MPKTPVVTCTETDAVTDAEEEEEEEEEADPVLLESDDCALALIAVRQSSQRDRGSILSRS